MGCWDCYCAICGGPLHLGDAISRKPRTTRFRRRHQGGEGCENASDVDSQPAEEAEEQEVEDDDSLMSEDEESLATSEEELSYDPDIISQTDIDWVETLHILGFNPAAPSTTKAFISGPGRYDMYGTVRVAPGDDPNFTSNAQFCYWASEGDDPVFPFHWCCFELLCKVLTGTTDMHSLDKDLLYSVLLGYANSYCSRLRTIDYGDPGPRDEQFWVSEAGKEFLVINPMETPPGLVDLITSTVTGAAFNNTSHSLPDLAQRVRNDPFTKLPRELVDKITFLLVAADLVNLSSASWSVFSMLSDNPRFWTRRIRQSMPWFLEVHDMLNQTGPLEGKNHKMLYLWLDQMTSSRLYMSGPFMGIANRRRVWHVCEQIADKYLPKLRQTVDGSMSVAARMIHYQSQCSYMPSVCECSSTDWELVSTFWVKSWNTIYKDQGTLETFWDSPGSLVGLGMSSSGGRQLLGIDDKHEGVSRRGIMIPREDWIKGFILHMSLPDVYASNIQTAVKGITVLLKSHPDITIGETGCGHPQRPFLVEGHERYLVGIMGQVGPVEGSERIQRFGVIQAARPPLDDYSMASEDKTNPPLNLLHACLWKQDYRNLLGRPIWEHPRLRVITDNSRDFENCYPSQEALIWAKNEHELRHLSRITASITVGGGLLCMSETGWQTRHYPVIHGMKAEFRPELGEPYRSIGDSEAVYDDDSLKDARTHFEIDGQGGEIFTEISFSISDTGKAIKLRTSKGREAYFGDAHAFTWRDLRPEEGETLVGLIMTFGGAGTLDESTKRFDRIKMLSVAALSMRL